MGKLRVIALALVVLVGFQANCKEYSSSLIVLKGAQEVKFTSSHGQQGVSYYRDDRFPGMETIRQIHDTLSAKGWTERRDDFLNPGVHLSAYSYLPTYIPERERIIHQWTAGRMFRNRNLYAYQWYAQFQNRTGDFLVYDFSYTDTYDPSYHEEPYLHNVPPKAHRLKVDTLYLPRKMADQLRNYAEKFRLKQTRP